MSTTYESFLRRLGGIHRNVEGDGVRVLHAILLTMQEMLRDRGCADIVCETNRLEESITNSQPVMWGASPHVRVFVHSEDKVGVKVVRSILDALPPQHVAVVVSIEGCTPFTKKECEGKPVQFFLARDVVVNLTKHWLVPRHRRVESPPGDCTIDQLPRILESDKVVQYYNWPIGTIVRITRTYSGHEPVDYFRVVSPDIN